MDVTQQGLANNSASPQSPQKPVFGQASAPAPLPPPSSPPVSPKPAFHHSFKMNGSPYLWALVMFVVGIGLGYLLSKFYPGMEQKKQTQSPPSIIYPTVVSPTVQMLEKEPETVITPESSPSASVSIIPLKTEILSSPSRLPSKTPEVTTNLSPVISEPAQ